MSFSSVIDKNGENVLTATFENKNLTEKDIITLLEYFLDQGVDPDIENKLRKTALLKAATRSMKSVVDFLIRRQANVKKIFRGGNLITYHLIEDWKLEYDRAFSTMSDADLITMEKESASYVEWLITKGFDFEHKNCFGESALSQSLKHGLQHIALVILKHTEHILNVTCDNQNNLLHQFFHMNGFLWKKYHKIEAKRWQNFNSRYASKIIAILLDKGLSAVDKGNNNYNINTPLFMSVAREEALNIIDILLDRLVWSNNQRSDVATTVLIELFKASRWWGEESRTEYFLKIARTLIAEGVDVNAKNTWGCTAVYYAFKGQNRRATDLLDENGADFSILYSEDTNLYHVLADPWNSSDEGQKEALFDLLASKACCEVNARDCRLKTPLHYACQASNLPIARKLIEHGADVNAKDSSGSTALHLSVDLHETRGDGDKLVEFLLISGAEVNCQDHNGKRPLACVTESTSRSSLLMLLKWGALVNDYQNESSTFSRVFKAKGFECAMDMLSYGLDMNDNRIGDFLCEQTGNEYYWEILTEFLSRYRIKHEIAKLPCSSSYSYFSIINCNDNRRFRENCSQELAKLKSTFIDSQTSLYDYLHMNLDRRLIHNNNEKLLNFVDHLDLLEKEFAEYSCLILAKYRTAVRWKSLLEPAKGAWLRLTHIVLPDVCIERIFAYLKIEELVVFVVDVWA